MWCKNILYFCCFGVISSNTDYLCFFGLTFKSVVFLSLCSLCLKSINSLKSAIFYILTSNTQVLQFSRKAGLKGLPSGISKFISKSLKIVNFHLMHFSDGTSSLLLPPTLQTERSLPQAIKNIKKKLIRVSR